MIVAVLAGAAIGAAGGFAAGFRLGVVYVQLCAAAELERRLNQLDDEKGL